MRSDLPSRAALASESWRLIRADQRAARKAFAESWITHAAAALLIAMLLYVLIGNKPYVHEVALDPLTGATEMSPINRYVWLALGGLSVPLLWLRRGDLLPAVKRLWPVLLLLGWFALTTRWAIDPAASSRRLLLYGINVVICVAVSLSLRSAQRTHQAMAIACGIVVMIDLLSWIIMPGRSMTDLGLAAIHSHKNTLGAVMLLAGFVCGTYAWGRPDFRDRLIWWSITLFSVILLVASRSKTSLGIFFAVAAFIPMLLLLLRQRPIVISSVVAAGALVAVTGVFFYLAVFYTLGLDPAEPFSGVTFTQRKDVWRFVYHQIELRPLQGVGFGSFWDVDPRVQPSLQTDHWFARPDAFTNEAHNGYLDIAVTTGLIGLAGAMIVLGRWMLGGLLTMRDAIVNAAVQPRAVLGAATLLGVFPLLLFGHNFMESSYFTANAIFGTIILIIGTDIDLLTGKRAA